ncbi:M20/M25/M40 family metallo-hydrolase [Komagataeibacter sp. AV436]|uniref:M20/M25/M40 family metallo-hydrolase n=1 Tax=Komagataeibacter melomenusus TaxID=2766578 RepID=A0ABX2AEY6_9PROT|nr:M20/M25/M40 family metallo-hydrolase [Komagataeibacter melomenusus]MBV1830757.1 M20/M25/M40 family metallo-hydrolase [Komagataeibacter melomenusus]NPC66414.1 M20/M25/M40 family metallo-hydrolase [Komagataeibacter melomenusus]
MTSLLDEIKSWVETESPTSNSAAVNRMMDLAQETARRAGLGHERFAGTQGYGDHVLVFAPDDDRTRPGILLLSHLDTVHPLGTLSHKLPYRIEGDQAFGPGIYDMKSGALMALAAWRELIAEGSATPLPIRQLFVSDEEIGSTSSRGLIETLGRKARYVLVTEPARPGGEVVTGRKGTARFSLHVAGRPAHSGTHHAQGRSAVKELARQILDLEALTDPARGITVNVGIIHGGTGANVVPGEATAEIDMRMPDNATGMPVVERILACQAHDPDVTVTVTGGINRPGYSKDAGISALFNHAAHLAAELGIDLRDVSSGGGSDGNFTAALGVPTLDGLGPVGAGAHTLHEHIQISSIQPRKQLLRRLLETLR